MWQSISVEGGMLKIYKFCKTYWQVQTDWQLRSNTDIIVLPSDKGRATVIMDRDDYNSKISEMLSDTTTYKKLNCGLPAALERKMNSTLLGLNRSGQIPDRLCYRLRSSSVLTPRIYGLPKIHKQDVPLHSIVSFYTSPTYQNISPVSSLRSLVRPCYMPVTPMCLLNSSLIKN